MDSGKEMIRTVAQLLDEFLRQERIKLDEYDLKHAPTIGKMYEGLTATILNRAIPEELGLQVVNGFIFDDSRYISEEIDCMLVKGDGEQIPYTSSFKWHIKNVIAVLEVKKTLYSKDLAESFVHIRGVMDSYSRYVQSADAKDTINITSTRKAFAEITKKIAPRYADLDKLPLPEQILFHVLLMEQVSPIRIILGHHGFQSEHSFRESMIKFLQANLQQPGFGVGNFPQLIVSESFSLVKVNGQPYSAPLRDGYWDFYVSSRENPLIFLLELIWTRLINEYDIGMWEEDLQQEAMHSFLSGRVIVKNATIGWDYLHRTISKKDLEKDIQPEDWKPVFIDLQQFVVLNALCGGKTVSLDDPELIKYIESQNLSMEEFTRSLLQTGLVALNGKTVELITEFCQCAVLPAGQFVAAENNTGRFTRWLQNQV